MTVTISRLYDSYTAALEAVKNLESAGVPHSDISIVQQLRELVFFGYFYSAR